jgi:hypothetical protein
MSHQGHGHGHGRAPVRMLVMIGVLLFHASVATCFLWAMHRIASALQTIARTKALKVLGDDVSAEDRRTIAEHIRRGSLRHF